MRQDVGCLGFNTIAGGVDTGLADAAISHLCGKVRHVLDYCGGHASPYHYHQSMDCLYSSSSSAGLTGHSTRIGTAIDGHPLYGKFISVNGAAASPTDLGNSLMIYICNFHVLSHLLLIYICKLHWNLNTMFVCQVNYF